ncbi:hypothetical protein [Shewanella colwelliana]|uniref:hypothetical protein n=1 Tax=Shewanella colwelliana TaxID=23 RepID=UPI0037352FC9
MYSGAFAFLVFVNPFIFGRVFWGLDVISLFFISVALTVLLMYRGCFELKISKPKFYLFIITSVYFISSSVIRISAGQHFGELSIHIYQYISVLALLCLRLDERNVEMIYRSVLVALVLHVWTIMPILPLNDFLVNRLSLITAYGAGEYSIGGLTRRATGFFPSPGYLSLFSSVAFVVGVFLTITRPSFRNVSIIFFACIAGFSAFSRTFLVIFCLVILYLFSISHLRSRFKLFFLALLVPIGMFFTSTSIYNDYFEFVGERLVNSTNIASNDRVSGETGVIMTYASIESSPFLGSAVSHDGGDVKAEINGIVVRPHFGLLAIIAFYGLITSGGLVLLCVWMLFRAIYLLVFKEKMIACVLDPSPFLAGYTVAFLICIAEPLIDTNITLTFLILSFLLISNANSNKIRIRSDDTRH